MSASKVLPVQIGPKPPLPIKNCAWCKIPFQPTREWQKFCKPICRTRYAFAVRPPTAAEISKVMQHMAQRGAEKRRLKKQQEKKGKR
jgi:hypothetical protein